MCGVDMGCEGHKSYGNEVFRVWGASDRAAHGRKMLAASPWRDVPSLGRLFLLLLVLARVGVVQGVATVHVFRPVPIGTSAESLSTLSELPLPSSLADDDKTNTMDPWATDASRAGLPIGLSGMAIFAGGVNVSIGGSPCESVQVVNDWEPVGSGSVGMVCEGVPEGQNGEVVSVEVWAEGAGGSVEYVEAQDVVRYSYLQYPRLVAEGKIGHGSGGVSTSTYDYFGEAVDWQPAPGGGGLLAVGVVGADAGGSRAGSVYILSIDRDGSVSNSVEVANGVNGGPTTTSSSHFFGKGVAWIGDVDEDGLAMELAVGAPETSSMTGSVYILRIAADANSAEVMNRITSGSGGGPSLAADDKFGASVACLGDINGDGRAEIAVGATKRDEDGFNDGGAVYIMEVQTSGWGRYLSRLRGGWGGLTVRHSESFGSSVARLWGWAGWEQESGAVVVVGGRDDGGKGAANIMRVSSSGAGTALRKLFSGTVGADSNDYFGTSAACLPDLDDNTATVEFMIGTTGGDTGGTDRGEISIISVYASSWGIAWMERQGAGTISGLSLAQDDSFGMSAVFARDMLGRGTSGVLLVGASGDDSSGTNRGAIHVLSIADRTDKTSPPSLVAAAPVATVTTSMPANEPEGLLSILPRLDPYGTDPTRTVLPIAVLTSTFDAFHQLRILRVLVGGRACGMAEKIAGWPVSDNSRRLGVACVGVPEGESGQEVGISVTFEVVSTGYTYEVASDAEVAQYDSVKDPIATTVAELPVDYVRSITWQPHPSAPGGLALVGFNSSVAPGGGVLLVSLQNDGTSASTIAITSGINGGPELGSAHGFGDSAAWIGDLNGDGDATEAAVGATEDTGTLSGSVYILRMLIESGTVAVVSRISDEEMGGPNLEAGERFGSAIACLGDVDGDGHSFNLAVGATGFDGNKGKVYVLAIEADGHARTLSSFGEGDGGATGPILFSGHLFGAAVSRVWGWTDWATEEGSIIVTGSPGDNSGGTDSGAIHFLLLSSDGSVATLEGTIENGDGNAPGLESSGGFGSAVCTMGDLDGVGTTVEILIGASSQSGGGAVYFLSVETSTWLVSWYRRLSSDMRGMPEVSEEGMLGSAIAFAGDMQGLGRASHALVGAQGDDLLHVFVFNELAGVQSTENSILAADPVDSISQALEASKSVRAIPFPPSSSLPQLQPLANSSTDRVLPLVVFAGVPNATGVVRVLNVSLGGKLCPAHTLLPDWPMPGSSSHRMGIACDGVPDGPSGAAVHAEVWLEMNAEVDGEPPVEFQITSAQPVAQYASTWTEGMAVASEEESASLLSASSIQLQEGDAFGSSLSVAQIGESTLFLVGAPFAGVAGQVILFDVSTALKSPLFLFTMGSSQNGVPPLENNAQFGHASVWIESDLDGNGRADHVLVSAVNTSTVYSMRIEANKVQDVIEIKGGSNGGPEDTNPENFGSSLSFLGDVDGDGLANEVLVGCQGFDSSSGAVYILSLLPTGGALASTRISANVRGMVALQNYDFFGYSSTMIPFIQGGDGTTIAVGASGDDMFGDACGSVYSMKVSSSYVVSTVRRVAAPGLLDGDQFGSAVASLGDIVGDGVSSSLLVGALGSQKLYLFAVSVDAVGTYLTEFIPDETENMPTLLIPGDAFGGALAALPLWQDDASPFQVAVGAPKKTSGRGGVFSVAFESGPATANSVPTNMVGSIITPSRLPLVQTSDESAAVVFTVATTLQDATTPKNISINGRPCASFSFIETSPRVFRVTCNGAGLGQPGSMAIASVLLGTEYVFGPVGRFVASIPEPFGEGVDDFSEGDWAGFAVCSLFVSPNTYDVLVGAPEADGSKGAVYAVNLANSPATAIKLPIVGEVAGDNFGHSCTALPLELDGSQNREEKRNTVIVGAPGDDTGAVDSGAVYVIKLQPQDLLSTSPSTDVIKIGNNINGGPILDGDSFGSSLASPGDLNADGRLELFVGASNYLSGKGAVYLLSLTATGTAASSIRLNSAALPPMPVGGAFGTLLAAMRVDPSIVVMGGAESFSIVGFVGVNVDSTFGTFGAADFALNAGVLPSSVCALDDVDGNGADDLAVGVASVDVLTVSDAGLILLLDLAVPESPRVLGLLREQTPLASNMFGHAIALVESAKTDQTIVAIGSYKGGANEAGAVAAMALPSLLPVPQITSRVASLVWNDTRNGRSWRCSTERPCSATWRNTERLDHFQFMLILEHAPLDISIVSVAIGDAVCGNITMIPRASPLRHLVKCGRLVLPPQILPTPVEAPTGASILLSNPKVVYRRSSSPHEATEVYAASPPPQSSTDFSISVFVPVSELVKPTASVVTMNPNPPGPLAIGQVTVALENFVLGDGNVVEGLRPSTVVTQVVAEDRDSLTWAQSVTVTARLCSAGQPTSKLWLVSLDGALKVSADVPIGKPIVTTATVVGSGGALDSYGGTVVRITGQNFGGANLSEANIVGSEADELCGSAWSAAGFARGLAQREEEPDRVILWAYIGGRPCDAVTWFSSDEIECVAPIGVGANLDVVVSVEGRQGRKSKAISYELAPPTAISPLTGFVTSGSLASLSVDHPYIPIVQQNPAFSVSGVVINGVWSAAASLGTLTFPTSTSVNGLNVPAGAGANHSVSLCFRDDVTSLFDKPVDASAHEGCTLPSEDPVLLSFANPIIVGVTPSVDLNPLGGDRLIIAGVGFGRRQLVLDGGVETSVRVGSQECLDVTHASDTEVRCTSGPLSGSATESVVVTVGGLSTGAIEVSVLRVSLLSVVPRAVMPAAPGELSYDFVISVLSASEVTAVVIGGQRCENPELEAEDQLRCRDVPAPLQWDSDNAWVEIVGRGNESMSEKPVLRAEPPPSILAVDVSLGAPTSGGVTASIVGVGFGLEDTQFAGVLVGGANDSVPDESSQFVDHDMNSVFLLATSPNVTWISSTKVSMILPSGYGRLVPVRVVTAYGLVSEPAFFAYEVPVPTSLEPSILLPGQDAVAVTVCGNNFPPVGGRVDSLVVAGAVCAEKHLKVLSDRCVRCTALATAGSAVGTVQSGWQSPQAVVVAVGGRQSSPTLALATFVPLPALAGANIDVVSPGTLVRLDGAGMGESAGYVEAVFVGGTVDAAKAVWNGTVPGSLVATAEEVVRISSSVTWISSVQLSFLMPPGVGRNIAIRFSTSTGLLSDAIFVSYERPTVTSTSPSVLLAGWAALNVTVRGSNFPTRSQDVTRVEIGGLECADVATLSPNELHCLNLATPSSAWPSRTVLVEAGGQQSVDSDAGATFVDAPSVTGVVPPTAGPGDEVQLVGTGFGASIDDIGDVLIGGESCRSTLQFESGTSVRCQIPSPHPIWVAAADGETVVPGVTVRVVLASGLASQSSVEDTIGTVVPSGLRVRPNPHVLPSGLVAWRPVAQSGTVVVRWRFPGLRLETKLNNEVASSSASESSAAAAAVSTFSVQVSKYSDFSGGDGEDVATSRGRTAPDRVADTGAVLSLEEPNAWEWFEARVPVFERAPLHVRIRAENSDGVGSWVVLDVEDVEVVGARVPEVCADSQYLATHAETYEEIVCQDCPEGATCAGLTSESVTAQSGYWRVPWAPSQLGFAECFIPSACIGTVGDPSKLEVKDAVQTVASNASVADRWAAADSNDRPKAIRGVQLSPSVEACSEGHRGVLCSACETNYFPGVGRVCTPCGDRLWIAARFGMLVAAILVMFSLLLRRAWAKRAETSSKEVMIAKIFFTHLQTVAIVGAVQLKWPSGASGFFAVVDAGSSFSTSGLALECLLGEASSSPFARTGVVLVMPVALLIYAATFWSAVWQCEQRCTCCSKRSAMSEASREELSWSTVLYRRMLVSAIVTAFLVHTPLTSAAFRLLTCQPVAPADDPSSSQLRLAMDLNFDCGDSATMARMLAMGVPMLIVISIGIPLGAALYLRSIGFKHLQLPRWRELLGFLYNGYRKKVYFWESVVLMRKVLLAFVTTILAPSGPSMQLLTAIVVILIAQILHSRSRPYVSNVINALESFGMAASALTLVGGLFVIVDEAGLAGTAAGTIGFVASAIIIVVNSLFFVAVVALVSKRGRTMVTGWYIAALHRFGLRAKPMKSRDIETTSPLFSSLQSPKDSAGALNRNSPPSERKEDASPGLQENPLYHHSLPTVEQQASPNPLFARSPSGRRSSLSSRRIELRTQLKLAAQRGRQRDDEKSL